MVNQNQIRVFFVVVGIIVLVLVALFSPSKNSMAGQASKSISDLQVQACTTADKAGTCQSRLIEVGIILPEQCCQQYGKCCQ